MNAKVPNVDFPQKKREVQTKWSVTKKLINNRLSQFRSNLLTYGIQPFGSEMTGDANEMIDTLVCHRFVNKFHIPSREAQESLRIACFESYVAYEEGHLSLYHFLLHKNWMTLHPEKGTLYKARETLHKWLQPVSFNSSFVDLEFTPGETYVPSKGHTSLAQKLGNKEHWTTTWSCLEDTCQLIYRHRALKKMARIHIGVLSPAEAAMLHSFHRGKPRHKLGLGYMIFRELLIERVLTIVNGARASSVDKDNDKRRFINVEATFPLLLQRAVARNFLSVLEKNGNKIGDNGFVRKGDGQLRHRQLIADPSKATVDFSNASDSILLRLVEFLFPPHWFKLLSKFRSYTVDIPGYGEFTPYKLSSMGNGFTFEVLSLVLLAIGRTLDTNCSTYGDDVVISNSVADRFVRVCSSVGFQPNMKKTFINSPFRESCGAFFHDNTGYITSFDFHFVDSEADLVTTANKAFTIAQAGYSISPSFQKLYTDLLVYARSSLKGPVPIDDRAYEANFDTYIFVKGYLRVHKEDPACTSAWRRAINDLEDVLSGYMIDLTGKEHHTSLKDCVVLDVPSFRSRTVALDDRVHDAAYHFAALRSGRTLKDTVRNKGKWVTTKVLVTPNGTVFRYARLRLLRLIRSQPTTSFVSRLYHDRKRLVDSSLFNKSFVEGYEEDLGRMFHI